jgi:hypothetical protein
MVETETAIASAHVEGRGLSIAGGSLNIAARAPISRMNAGLGAAAMEVDRVGRMDPVRPERTPAWTREGMRRRRFVPEVEPEVEGDSEEPESGGEDEPAGPADPGPDLDVLA